MGASLGLSTRPCNGSRTGHLAVWATLLRRKDLSPAGHQLCAIGEDQFGQGEPLDHPAKVGVVESIAPTSRLCTQIAGKASQEVFYIVGRSGGALDRTARRADFRPYPFIGIKPYCFVPSPASAALLRLAVAGRRRLSAISAPLHPVPEAGDTAKQGCDK